MDSEAEKSTVYGVLRQEGDRKAPRRRASDAAGTRSGILNFQNRRRFLNRTTHVLIGPDNSHASDMPTNLLCRRTRSPPSPYLI